ncbi:hypothetical protein KUTeg_007885 [Tegillarca granosa]|uniref:Uncharacterized protein n=1 Tax=Tegillarca granosa TaxID=220873 RepID=A0ABQ9FJ73_TEGGR|nr:hypothetical protein KUTeg_007885 [Tegillarca granosa]
MERNNNKMGSLKVRFSLTPSIKIYDKIAPPMDVKQMIKSATLYEPRQKPVVHTVRHDRQHPVSLSIDDIYYLAERERLCYSAKSRRQAVQSAQSSTYKLEEFFSRPNTSASRYIHAHRRETMTPKSIRSEPLPSRVSSRLGGNDFDDDDLDYPINIAPSPVSRDCCEIIGPEMCQECIKSYRRQMDREKSEARFPSLRISEGNLTTTAILKRYMPDLTDAEIQDRVARGEIASSRLPVNPNNKLDNDDEYESGLVQRKRQFVVCRSKNSKKPNLLKFSAMFFTNIRDLNHRIVTGKADRSIGFLTVKPKSAKPSEGRSLFPVFVSERKIKPPNENKYKTYFDPPLLPRNRQKPEPPFFAGSDDQYEVPKRLPEKLEFIDARSNQRLRSSSVLSDAPVDDIFSQDDTQTEETGNHEILSEGMIPISEDPDPTSDDINPISEDCNNISDE